MDDLLQDAVDLGFWEHQQECPNNDHDDCYDQEADTWLIGYRYSKKKKIWIPDKKNHDWSGWVSMDPWYHTTVVWSKWFIYGALCSPCCPGQGSIGELGRFLMYAPPPDVVGGEIAKAIFGKGACAK